MRRGQKRIYKPSCLTYNALPKDSFHTPNQINRESNASPETQIPERENIVLLIEYCM